MIRSPADLYRNNKKKMVDNSRPRREPLGGLRVLFGRVVAKLNTEWLRATYPFVAFGRGISVDPAHNFWRPGSRYMALGDDIYLAQDVWLHVVEYWGPIRPKLVLGKGCSIGRRSTISAKNYVELEDDVLLGPNVFIMDYNHEYSDPTRPIHAQGVTEGGRVVIGRNSWLGYGSVICSGRGQLTLGRNCVVGANSVVTRSFPDFSVIAGSPAKLIKTYDQALGKWVRVDEEPSYERSVATIRGQEGERIGSSGC